MHFCHIAASCLLTYTSVDFYTLHYGSITRGVTKGQGGAITRAPNHSGGAEILWGRRQCRINNSSKCCNCYGPRGPLCEMCSLLYAKVNIRI